MATQRQTTARSKPTIPPPRHRSRSPSISPSKISHKSSIAAIGSHTISQTEDGMDQKDNKREAERLNLFQTTCNKALKIPNGYVKVAVLILRWDEKIDDFPGHTEEIERLRNIFENKYKFECHVHPITNTKKPQLDLNMAISKHITNYDDPNSLLIFYYTGHGSNRYDSGLELSATRDFNQTNGRHLATALWARAEQSIRDDMDGDALSILDCCMASVAATKRRNGLARTYQMLAASSADAPTRGPGKHSFTAALCASLEDLFDEANGETFPLTKLYEMINKKRTSQACVLWDRFHGYDGRNILLGKLANTKALEDSFCNEAREESSLCLRFSFNKGDLDHDQITQLAKLLPKTCDDANLPIRRIDWLRMTTTNQERAQMNSFGHDTAFDTIEAAALNPFGNMRPLSAHVARRWQHTGRAIIAANRFGMGRIRNGGELEAVEDIRDEQKLCEIFLRNIAIIPSLCVVTALLYFVEDKTTRLLCRGFLMLVFLSLVFLALVSLSSLYPRDGLWRMKQP